MSSLSQISSESDLFDEMQKRVFRYDFRGAVEVLQKAHRLNPTNDKILVDLGAMQGKAYDIPAAEATYDRAISISRSPAQAINTIGHCWLELRKYEAAKKCYERILDNRDTPMLAFIRLAEIYIRLRKLEEAFEITERAWKIYGSHEGILVTRARILREMKEKQTAENFFRVVTSKPAHSAEIRAMAWYEIAAMNDEKGDYDGAMAALIEAKALMRTIAGNALKILPGKQASMREIRQTIKPEMVEKWRKAGKTDLQPERKAALLCGHARSGTTLLEYIVDAHPGVISAEETSIFHNVAYYPIGSAMSPNSKFISVLDWLSPRVMRQIRSEYFRGVESFLGESIGDRLLLDKNPANTFDIPAIARIFPETKFLVALRDPRDVCLSAFMQPASILPDTSAWLTLEGTMNHYAHIMGIWLACKPCLGEQALEVRYEDITRDIESTARKTLDFLGLPWDERVLRPHERASNSVVRSPTYVEVTKPVFRSSVGRWKNYQKYFEPQLALLEPFCKAFGY